MSRSHHCRAGECAIARATCGCQWIPPLLRVAIVNLAPVSNALVEKGLLITAASLCASSCWVAGFAGRKLLGHECAALSGYLGGDGQCWNSGRCEDKVSQAQHDDFASWYEGHHLLLAEQTVAL
jgi:hypothetical protein